MKPKFRSTKQLLSIQNKIADNNWASNFQHNKPKFLNHNNKPKFLFCHNKSSIQPKIDRWSTSNKNNWKQLLFFIVTIQISSPIFVSRLSRPTNNRKQIPIKYLYTSWYSILKYFLKSLLIVGGQVGVPWWVNELITPKVRSEYNDESITPKVRSEYNDESITPKVRSEYNELIIPKRNYL